MATSHHSRSNQALTYVFFSLVLSVLFFSDSTASAQNLNLKDACFRLEGVMMPCSGGGGCGESCDASRQAGLCSSGPDGGTRGSQGYKICGNLSNGGVTCGGTKCCQTCEGMAYRYNECTNVIACGSACTNKGTKASPDCSKSSCTHWVQGPGTVYEQECWWEVGTGPDVFTCSGNCQGDGCSKSCRVSGGNSCQVVGTCTCNLTCQSGVTPGQTYRSRKCKAKVAKTVTCWSRSTIPRVSNGNCGCQCPSSAVSSPPSEAVRCGSTVIIEKPDQIL